MKGVAFAVPNGAKVTAGQQIAWNGDSGDANGNPHLHFEVHPNDGGGREPVQAPEARDASRSSQRERDASSASACAESSSPRAPARRRSRSTACASTRAAAGSTSTLREVELTVPLGAEIAPSLELVSGATLRTFKKPVPVAAYTLKANATPEAIVGAPGELILGRVAPAP